MVEKSLEHFGSDIFSNIVVYIYSKRERRKGIKRLRMISEKEKKY